MPADLREKLMTEIINLFADKFGNHAILKGGMELRLLDCPRFTNDLDYQFVPYVSKNDVKDVILAELRNIPDTTVSLSAYSTCIRFMILRAAERVQVEVNVAIDCKTQVLSTASLARIHQLQPRLIRAMRLDCALAHKLAAWNERELIRDLYDTSFLTTMLDVLPDMDTMRMRLSDVKLRQGRKTITAVMSIGTLCDRLEAAAARLDSDMVAIELRDYFAPVELAGLELKIRVAIHKVVDFLRRSDTVA